MPVWLRLILQVVQTVLSQLLGSEDPMRTASEIIEHLKTKKSIS